MNSARESCRYIPAAAALLCAFLLLSCSDDTPTEPPRPEHQQQDTTSHDITWEVFEFGKVDIEQSIFRDIYALSDDNIWAVGKIQRTEEPDPDIPIWEQQDYNAVHWDGQKWTLHNITTKISETDSIPLSQDLHAVLGFNTGDFVFVPLLRSYFILHDGENTQFKEYDGYGDISQIRRIWGTSKDDFYCAGSHGAIAHYYNDKVHPLYVGTRAIITDIHGNSEGHVFTGGWDSRLGEGPLFHIYHDQIEDLRDSLIGYCYTSFATKDSLYAFIDKGFYIQAIDDPAHRRFIPRERFIGIDRSPTGRVGVPNCMRGTADNNIIVVGYYANLIHYNGKSVELLNYEQSSGVRLLSVSVTKKHFYAAGANAQTGQAVIYKGTFK